MRESVAAGNTEHLTTNVFLRALVHVISCNKATGHSDLHPVSCCTRNRSLYVTALSPHFEITAIN
jgi:hypothetical protein